jgi:hypothetical protein
MEVFFLLRGLIMTCIIGFPIVFSTMFNFLRYLPPLPYAVVPDSGSQRRGLAIPKPSYLVLTNHSTVLITQHPHCLYTIDVALQYMFSPHFDVFSD